MYTYTCTLSFTFCHPSKMCSSEAQIQLGIGTCCDFFAATESKPTKEILRKTVNLKDIEFSLVYICFFLIDLSTIILIPTARD